MTTSTGFRPFTSSVTPKRFNIAGDASTSIDAIAAVTDRKLSIIALSLDVDGAGTLIYNSDSTEIGRSVFQADERRLILPWNPDGWLETAIGEKFNIGNAGTLSVSGFGTYVEIG